MNEDATVRRLDKTRDPRPRQEIEAWAKRHMEQLRRELAELADESGVAPPAELTVAGLLEFLLGLGVNPAIFLPALFHPAAAGQACHRAGQTAVQDSGGPCGNR